MATKALRSFFGGFYAVFAFGLCLTLKNVLLGLLGQFYTVLGHPAGCFVAQHPLTAPVLGGVLRLAVGESGQPPKVPPVGAVQVGSVLLRKVLASDGGHLRRQRPIRQTHPCLVV